MNEKQLKLLKSFETKDILILEDNNKVIISQIFNEIIINKSEAKKILAGMLKGYGFKSFKIDAEENEEDGKIMAFAIFDYKGGNDNE